MAFSSKVSYISYTIILLSVCSVIECLIFRSRLPKKTPIPVSGSPGEPIFITPFLDRGDYQGGQKASTVPALAGNIVSYAGYITVNKRYNSNTFFWYFPSETSVNQTEKSNKPKHDPATVLWLQGGPGCSSMFGLFEENGPYFVDEDGIHLRKVSWTKDFNVLYIDNPVGTGFSFTQDSRGYATTEDDVARDLYSALVQFFQLFPEISSTDFYITGESYAGKYIPAVADLIHRKNPSATTKINLKGLFIGNGFTDPQNMLVYSDYLFQLGLIDNDGFNSMKEGEEKIKILLNGMKYEEASTNLDNLLETVTESGVSVYDYSKEDFSSDFPYESFIQQDSVRRSIHVGSFLYHDFNEQVYYKLLKDMLQSVAYLLPELLKNYKVLFYNGQYDIIVAYPLTVNFLNELSWDGAYSYQTAKRNAWYVGSDLAGYYKTVHNLTEVLVREASHMVPASQPVWAYNLLQNFVNGNYK